MTVATAEHQAARRPQVTDQEFVRFNDPTVQWSNHLETTTNDKFYDGFLIPMNQENRENGPELDAFLKEIGQETVVIQHTDKKKKYWAMPTMDAFILANGVQSWAEIKIDTNPLESAFVRYGIAAAWNDNVRSSYVKFRFLPVAWLAAGWEHPLTYTSKGYASGDVLKALTRHFDLLDAIDAHREVQKKAPLNPPYYEVSVELVPGDRIMRGKKGAQSKVVQLISGVPEDFDIKYVGAHYIKPEWKELIGSMVPQTVLWSVNESKYLASFKDKDADSETAPAAQVAQPPMQGNGRNVPQSLPDGEDLPF
jgi:hypothetical protein